MRIDFIGVGFGRSGSNGLCHCLYEHPEISIPKFNLHTEINYFPEEYEVMGLKNYIKKFKNCDFSKVVGEISTMIIMQKRSAKLLKKLFPNVKIIIYKRPIEDWARSMYNTLTHHDMLNAKKEDFMINQDEYIRPWIKEFGEKNVFVYDLEKADKNKQKELNNLYKFLGVSEFTPPSVNVRRNSDFKDKERKVVKTNRIPFLRKNINPAKNFLARNKKLYYFMKRNLKFDYYYQMVNHAL